MEHGFRDCLDERIDLALKKIVSEKVVTGCAIMVGRHGELVTEAYEGFSDLAGTKPIDKDTVYRMYSMTKVITVTAALQLWEKSVFSLSDPLSKYIPEFEHMKVVQKDGSLTDAENPILIKHVLTMTAGFAYEDADGYYEDFAQQWYAAKARGEYWDTVTAVKKFAALPLMYEPGTKYRYSFGFDVLGALIEIWSGETLADYCKKHIFEPLGMKNSGFRLSDIDASKLADFHGELGNGLEITDRLAPDGDMYHTLIDVSTDYSGTGFYSGGAGLLCTIGDYFKFARMLARGGEADGVRILGSRTVEFMHTPQLNDVQRKYYDQKDPCCFSHIYSYGLGVRVLMQPHTETCSSIGEWGWSGALGPWLQMDPKEDLFYVYCHQRTPSDNPLYVPYLNAAIYSSLE